LCGSGLGFGERLFQPRRGGLEPLPDPRAPVNETDDEGECDAPFKERREAISQGLGRVPDSTGIRPAG